MTLPAPLPSTFNARLAVASTPQETNELTAISAAAYAYYKEQQDYEGMVKATAAYFMSRRKTTELIKMEGDGNGDVTVYKGYGFTKMQWHRRMKELKIELEQATAYFDECIAKGWNPSIAGVISYVSEPTDEIPPIVRDTRRLLSAADEMTKYDLTAGQSKALDMVRKEFAE
jgi:hypothetical protein